MFLWPLPTKNVLSLLELLEASRTSLELLLTMVMSRALSKLEEMSFLPGQWDRHTGGILMGSGTLSRFSQSVPNKALLVHLHFKHCQSPGHLGTLRAVPTTRG